MRRLVPGALPPERLPVHVAIIMDGNGRWARRRGMPRSAGHRAGVERIEDVLRATADCGVKYLTLFAFSTENWRRSPEEVAYLMQLLAETLTERAERLRAQGVALRFIGRRDRLPPDLVAKMAAVEAMAPAEQKVTLTIAIDYGSRDEILRAARSIAEAAKEGRLAPEELTEEVFSDYLYTRGLPDPDLIIRTSGEQRISNFLLWQGAYAEYWFTPVLWPDFTAAEFIRALQEYARRERRFGRA
ncbi:MAG: isoprenyl transferase [Bacillota bacterium]